jgi:hypothetical protein
MRLVRLLTACGLLCGLLAFMGPVDAEGHSREITQCKGNIVYKKAERIGKPYVVESNGLIAEDYDTNGDKRTDVIALSHPDGASHKEHPVFWIVDLDFDGEPDAVYIDKYGLGKCTDIVLYQDLTKPTFPKDVVDPKKPLLSDRGGKL